MDELVPRSVLPPEQQRSMQIAAELRQLIEGNVRSGEEMRRVSRMFAINLRTLYRMRERLKEGGLLTPALAPRKPGPKAGTSRFPPEVDNLIDDVLRREGLTRQKPSISALVKRVHDECRDAGFVSRPKRKAIKARYDKLSARERALSREGRRAAEPYTPSPGEFPPTTRPNEVWLIDHTPVDVILVDRRYRRPLGRPTATLIIDAYSRMIPGYFLSFGKPSTIHVAQALMHAIWPKEDWLNYLAVAFGWPIYGIPRVLHADNASEFHAAALKRACIKHDIEPQYRTLGKPQCGALIERAIGTFMGEVHLLPGTTFSNVRQRGEYDSAKMAAMTLDEFDRWFALQVINYHSTAHRGINNFTPQSLWERAEVTPRPPVGGYRPDFLLDFMPEERRNLRPTGIHMFALRYWADWLAADLAVGRRYVDVRFDERDISSIFVEDQSGAWQPVPLWDRQEPFSRREHEATKALLSSEGKSTHNEALLHEIRKQQRAIVQDAVRQTVRARRAIEAADRGYDLALPPRVTLPSEPTWRLEGPTGEPQRDDERDGEGDVEIW